MKYTYIESRDNSLVKHFVKLTQNTAYRNETGECMLHGLHLVIEAGKAGLLTTLIINKDSLLKYKDFISLNPSLKLYSVSQQVMQKISFLDTPVDIVGVANFCPKNLDQEVYTSDCIILENIQDPGNLGTILRAAMASGVSNIIISKGNVDPYNPKVLRSSQGIQFGLNIIQIDDLSDFIRNYKFTVIATTPTAKDSIYLTDLTKPVAWVFGNEGLGISPLLLSGIKEHRTIPMSNSTESLNVAMAATVCLFETYRQRLNQ